MKKLLLAAVSALAVTSAYADQFNVANTDLATVKTLRCHLDQYSFVAPPVMGEDKEIEYKSKDGSAMDLVFDSLDLTTHKGRLIGNAGADDVSVWGGAQHLNIIESVPAGGLTVLTVYKHSLPADGSLGENLFATYSRHVGDDMMPMASHFAGVCKVML